MAERTVTVRLRMLTAEWISPLERARAATVGFARDSKQAIKDFNAEMDKAAPKRRMNEIAEAATGMGLAVGAAFTSIALAAAAFDKAMDEVEAVSQTTAEGLDRLRNAALEAGMTTKYSAREAAQAEAELARAGMAVSDIVGGGLRGALALAAAGQLDLEESAVTVAKALHAFNLEGSQAGHVADVLAAAANKSATNVHEMALASKMSALVASQMGLTFEEASGALALFADNALAGSDGGTSLKVMLMMLARPTIKSSKLMKQLGLDFFDAQGNFIGLAGTAAQLQAALGGLTEEQRNYAITQIFGADASRAANILYKEGAAAVEDYTAAVNDAGYAQKVADKLTDNLAGDWERLTSALEGFAVTSGGGAADGLRGLTQGATALVQQLAALPTWLTSSIVLIGGLTAGALLLFAALIKVKTGLALANAQLQKMGPLGNKVAGTFSKIGDSWGGKFAGRLTGALALMQGVGAVAGAFSDADANIEELTGDLVKFYEECEIGGQMAKLFGNDLQGLTNDLEFLRQGLGNAENGAAFESLLGLNNFSWSTAGRLRDLKTLDEALASLQARGPAGAMAAANAFRTVQAKAQEAGVSTEILNQVFNRYRAAVEDTAKANDKNAQVAERNASANALMAAGMQAAANSGKTLIQVFEELNGEALTLAEAEIAVERSMDDLVEAMKKAEGVGKKGFFDVDTPEGRERKEMALGFLKDAAAYAQAVYDQTGNMQTATKAYQDYLKELLKAPGLTAAARAQLQLLIDTYGKIPEFKNTVVTVEYMQAQQAIRDITAKVLALKDKTIRISAQVYWTSSGDLKVPGGTILKNDRGGVYEHAAVGTLRDAAVYSSVARGARYAFAEPSTGGEAFVPRNGSYARSTAIIDHAARWYGGTFSPGRSAAASPSQVINNNWTINPQRADIGINEMRAWQAQANALARVGRSR